MVEDLGWSTGYLSLSKRTAYFIFIEHKASGSQEIIHLLTSICLSVNQFVCALTTEQVLSKEYHYQPWSVRGLMQISAFNEFDR